MIVNVRMLAFHDNEIRQVVLPYNHDQINNHDVSCVLSDTFYWGQNDHCDDPAITKRLCSVSVGDVIEYPENTWHLVCSVGFKQITAEELGAYIATPRRDRAFSVYLSEK